MPGVFGQMSRWVPPAERGRCGALVLGGKPSEFLYKNGKHYLFKVE